MPLAFNSSSYFLTSVFLLPAIITAWYETKSRIAGNGTWIKFEGDAIIEESDDSIKDAVLMND